MSLTSFSPAALRTILRAPASLRPLLIQSKALYHSNEHPEPPPYREAESAILSSAIKYVPVHGFTQQSLTLGAKDVGYLDISTNLFPRGAYDLVLYYLVTQRLALKHRIQFPEDQKLGVGRKAKSLILERLRANIDTGVLPRYQEALSLMSLAENIPSSLRELGLLSDEIWYLAGDTSVDASWYTKRGTLSGVYAATEVFQTTVDQSTDMKDTEEFLDRRLEEVRVVGSAVGGFGEWVGFQAGAVVNLMRMKATLNSPPVPDSHLLTTQVAQVTHQIADNSAGFEVSKVRSCVIHSKQNETSWPLEDLTPRHKHTSTQSLIATPNHSHRPHHKDTHSTIRPTMEAFRFGDLPLELRAMIYRYLLVHRPLQRDGIDTSILSVCRQLKQEGEDVLYGENDVLVGINILHDGITFDARIPGIFARETTSADRHIGAGLHTFPVCLSRFRKVKVGISVEDGQNARQQEDLSFQSYLLAALLTQTHARMVTVTFEDGACELEVVDALRPLAALGPGIKVTFNGLPKEATAGLHTDSDFQESLLKSNAAEWYKTDAEITSLINNASGPGALFGLESIVDELRRQVYWLKTGGRDLSHAITNLKRMLDTGKRRMLETQQWREQAFPPKVKSPMALARRLAT